MSQQDIERRLHALCLQADRYRQPGPRRTTETCMAEFEEIRDGMRRLFRDLTGAWPRHDGEGAATATRAVKPPIPTAILRHRERTRNVVRRA